MTRPLVRRRLREMYLGGIGAQTNKAHQMIRGTLSFAIGEEIQPDIILYNPGTGFGRVAPIKPRMRTLKDEERRIFWRAPDEMRREIVSPAGQRVCLRPRPGSRHGPFNKAAHAPAGTIVGLTDPSTPI